MSELPSGESPQEFLERAALYGALTNPHLIDAALVRVWSENLEASGEYVVLMKIARRWGRPVTDLIEDANLREAIAAEVAYDLHLAEDAERRCSRCGTSPDEFRKPSGGKRGVEPLWRFEVQSCDGCLARDQEERAAAISDDVRAFTSIRMVRNRIDDEDDDEELEELEDDDLED